MRLGKAANHVLDEWKAARTLLTDALQSYLDASATLRAACTSSSHRSPDSSLVEEALVTIDSELESLTSEAKSLFDMRISGNDEKHINNIGSDQHPPTRDPCRHISIIRRLLFTQS
ncbi:hypothetical protein FRC12_018652 [Ceratobasidium sp. 428]|nr:hypothetical protein FRC12_018652 [Ceratobasidium sp. 428]